MRRCQYDQNTLKFDQKHHFYATILARRRQTLKSGEPRSPDPGVSTGKATHPSFFRIFPFSHFRHLGVVGGHQIPWLHPDNKFSGPGQVKFNILKILLVIKIEKIFYFNNSNNSRIVIMNIYFSIDLGKIFSKFGHTDLKRFFIEI